MATLKRFRLPEELNIPGDRHRSIETRIRIRIPKQFQQEPIISNLITQHQLTVNITAALLSANAREDGWFDLQLQGSIDRIQEALMYLNDLDLEIWYDSEEEEW